MEKLRLKEYRENLGYTIEDISDFLGIPINEYIEYEDGIKDINLVILEKLSNLYFIDELDFYSSESYNDNAKRKISSEDLKEISEFYSLIKSYLKLIRLISS